MSYETRPQAYDETIKILEKKDHRGIAEFILPSVKDAEEVALEHTKLSVPDIREMDYLAKIKLNQENFILHIEFESAYRSNIEMQKRMLRYYTYIKWHNDLPIYQVLVLLKKPDNVKRIKNGINSRVQGLDIMRYRYGVIKAYEIDKYEVLAQKQVVLYPLQVFMKHDSESEEEHIQECLTVTEGLEDKDYYFLTLECIKRLYQKGKYEKFVKEEILMQSALYKEPYEKGLGEGIEKGRREGETETLARAVIKFLVKKFDFVPEDLKQGISKLDAPTLDVILDRVLDFEKLDDVKKYIQ